MTVMVKCMKCGHEFEIPEALLKELRTNIIQETQSIHNGEIRDLEQKQYRSDQQNQSDTEQVKREMADTLRKDATEKTKMENDARTTLIQTDTQERQNQDVVKKILDLLNQIK